MISIIVAMDEKRGIGKENALMWNIPGELPRFKRITTGHPIIMGRKTFESIGRVLPGRLNIVMSRSSDKNVSDIYTNCVFVNSLENAIQLGRDWEESRIKNQESSNDILNSKFIIHNSDENEIFIIGGGQIFTEALPSADRLYLTIVKGDFGADVFFPDYSEFGTVVEKEEHKDGEYEYTFLTLEKANV